MPRKGEPFQLLAKSDLDVDSLSVFAGEHEAGTLALTQDGLAAFEYADSWIESGFALNPFSLPLEKGVHVAKYDPFDGLFGAFDDSLPDGWGRLLVDRFMRGQGIDPMSVSQLGRLALVGFQGMGALGYLPSVPLPRAMENRSLDELSEECSRMLQTNFSDDLDELFALGGSSGGARPKIFTIIDGEDWIVKFPSSIDHPDIGFCEHAIALAAGKAGIEMPPVSLLPSAACRGYFAIKRFDRVAGEGETIHKLHMMSAGALLETSHRVPNLDYDILMKLTLRLTEDMEQVEAMFRLMCFNIAVGNRDDHAKNFSFIRELERDARWLLSPGYDLTSNSGINGEHCTTANGKGRDITADDMLAVGMRAGISASRVRDIVSTVLDVVHDELEDILAYPGFPALWR